MNFTISSLLAHIEGALRRLNEDTNGSTLLAAENSANTSSGSSRHLKGSLNGSYFQSYDSNVFELDTINYLNEINRSNYTFACFFDPRSAAFSILQNVFGNASAMAATDNARYGNVRFVAIDASRNAYLTENIAPMMTDAEQQKDRDEFDLFEFGRPNFFPLIFMLFRHGVPHKEYTGVVSEVSMLEFLYRQTHSDAIKVFKLSDTINETQKLDSFLTLEKFVVLKCSWKINNPPKQKYNSHTKF